MKLWLVALFTLLLLGCGGSGSPDTTSGKTDTQLALEITGSLRVVKGDSVALAVTASDQSPIETVTWSVSDAAFPILAPHTQAIGFDATKTGNFSIDVEATLNSGTRLSKTVTLTVVEGTSPAVIVRLAHQATEGGRVSLQLDTNRNASVRQISWTQLQGPQAVDVKYDDVGTPSKRIFFKAPQVLQDSVIEYEATVSFSDGHQASDSTLIVVKNADVNSNGFFPSSDLIVTEQMQPYRADSPYAQALSDCVYNNQLSRSCTFEKLPLIGQVTDTPTIDDILDRTYVSHPWMGDALRDFLAYSSASEDLINMLRATTAIVISYEVRPSFYWVVTGAIYLDANNFWRTPEERDTVNTEPDYRSEFGLDLDYVTTWRYVKNQQYYYPQPGLAAELRNSRTLLGIEQAISWLLYHELAHANDFFPPTSWSSLTDNETPLSYVYENAPQSDGLILAHPLMSTMLEELAQVNYGGADATSDQLAITAEEVAWDFERDGAASFYSYYTAREDYATLVERFMMLYRLGVSSDVGVFSSDAINRGDLSITWGQRDRINDPSVQPRVKYAVNRVLPELDVDAIQLQLPDAELLPPGVSWFDVLYSAPGNFLIPINELPPATPQFFAVPSFEQTLKLPAH
ncbi:hypothetical protein DXV75_04605 [Alteromonas aestuariivivens]|uniref:PKD domain-containing protein n=1 Tax=Alteromonas aestuariivivens TaxID=1938339 RepID=A0A3D8MBC1_9ALTE|nr:hypothetical protein [Alteromonas aestuariivivens]RDV27326.1 hypothetical protein DXV75_04605 [Alteromonas aestuariivivens]